MSRICIVTPGPVGSNPRVVKEAQALHEAGHAVEVIATRPIAAVEPLDAAIMRSADWRLLRLDVHSPWRWRARRAAQSAVAGLFDITGQMRLADDAFSAVTPALRAAARATRADLYIAHYPAALPAAAAAARRHGARYAYDAEDFHLGDRAPSPEHDRHRALIRTIEARLLPGCAHVTAASPGIADAYAQTYAIARPTVVLNTFPLAQAPPGPTPRGKASPGPSVYWFSQTIGPDRGLENAVCAAARARTRPHLYLRGTEQPAFATRLHTLAAEAGAPGAVHILPSAPPHEMEQLASVYDCGLVAETAVNRNREIALTNKLFTYLLAGLPPLMSAISAHRAFAQETGTEALLFAIDDPDALAAAFDRLLGDPDALRDARAQAFRLGRERYNWDHDRAILLDRVKRSLHPVQSA